MFPGDLTIDVLAAAMHGTLTRNKVLAHNLANADTPGYQRLDVQFEAELARATEQAREASKPGAPVTSFERGPGAVSSFSPEIRQITTTQIRIDGSNFDADSELAALSANQLAYQTIVSLLDKKFGQISAAITG